MNESHDKTLDLIASSAFGLESQVRYELSLLGYEARGDSAGRVKFRGDATAICRTNVWLRTADRVLVLIDRFSASDFDALFETTRAIPWEQWIPIDGAFPVNGRSRKSQLTSVPAVQRAVKRAIVDRLLQGHGVNELPETGPKFSIEVALLDNIATLTIDTTGPSLHKRGYRDLSGSAPLKETLAAAMVQLSFWTPERPLIDPFCGTGTIPIEAAMIGRNLAPGLARSFPAELWPMFAAGAWDRVREEARSQIGPTLPIRILGTDTDGRALSMARRHAERAGVADDVHFQQKPFEQLSSKRQFGCVITNPPYGQRMGERREVEALHRSFPQVLRALPTWSHFILTAQPDFERMIQKTADRRRKLYNGRIECTYYQFHGPKPGAVPTSVAVATVASNPMENDSNDALSSPDRVSPGVPSGTSHSPRPPVFGGLTEKAFEQAELFRSRLQKRSRHLRRWPTRQDIHCFRIYERDIPEIPLVVDRYEDHLHITEYERPHDRDLAQHADWLDLMKQTAAKALEVEPQKVFLKQRLGQRGGQQYEKTDDHGYQIVVREGGLKFWVNLSDYVDTGLFLDHRITRSMVRDDSRGRRVLNLFAYSGAFSVYAADGAAEAVTTVDWTPTYLDWARRNFELNAFRGGQYRFVREEARRYLAELSAREQFDLAIVDPPTYSNSRHAQYDWDVQRDYADLLIGVLHHLSDGGRIYFSTNFRRFKFQEDAVPATSIREISRQTVPEDFRNRRIHRCWLIDK